MLRFLWLLCLMTLSSTPCEAMRIPMRERVCMQKKRFATTITIFNPHYFSTMVTNTSDMFFKIFPQKRIVRNKTMLFTTHLDWDPSYYESLVDGHYKHDIIFPVRFYHRQCLIGGSILRDFLPTSWVDTSLISDHFKTILEKNKITGWKTYPAILYDHEGKEITTPKYHGFTITGRCGPRGLHQADGTLYNQGIHLNPAMWDGSDLFLEEEYWDTFISARAVKVFKQQDELKIVPTSTWHCDRSRDEFEIQNHKRGHYRPRFSKYYSMSIKEIFDKGILTQEGIDEMVKKVGHPCECTDPNGEPWVKKEIPISTTFLHAKAYPVATMPTTTTPMFCQISPRYRWRRKTMELDTRQNWDVKDYKALLEGCYKPDITFPLRFYPVDDQYKKYEKYKTLRDFLHEGVWGSSPLLISDHFKTILEKNKITGWKTYPAILCDREGNEITTPKYHGFTITGRCGPRILYRPQETLYKKDVDRDLFDGKVHLDAATWDGSDIFFEEEYWDIFISARAAKVFKKQNELIIEPLDRDFSVYKGTHQNYIECHQEGYYSPRASTYYMTIEDIIAQGILTQEGVDEMLKKIRYCYDDTPKGSRT